MKLKYVPISNILEKVLDSSLYSKYEKKFGFAPTADYLYQWALISLNESNTDKSISYIISALDVDRKHAPTLHLIKSMIIGLGKDFYENGGAYYKQRYPDLDVLIKTLKKKILVLKRKRKKLQDQIDDTERILEKGNFITKFFNKMKHEQSILTLKNQVIEYSDKIERQRSELKKVRNFKKNEEYSKILGTILEICVIPTRYSAAVKEQ